MKLSKEEFIEYIEFIQMKRRHEMALAETFEMICPGYRCDTLIYNDYEDKLLELLVKHLNDTGDLIRYKLYEFDEFDDVTQGEQIMETPEVATWETVYDYLVGNEQHE